MAGDTDGPNPGKRQKTSGSGTKSRYAPRISGEPPRWGSVDAVSLVECLDALQSAGDALLCGTSRDGMVLVTTVCSGDERVKFFAKTVEEMEEHLAEIKRLANFANGK